MLTMRYLVLLLSTLLLKAAVDARMLTRCELAMELSKQGIPAADLPNWVCLVEAESRLNTTAIGAVNKDGSRDYGLFQINNKYWCSETKLPGKDCNLRCTDLTNDSITDDIQCAKKIYARHQFLAWNGWKSKCRNVALPNLSSCGTFG